MCWGGRCVMGSCLREAPLCLAGLRSFSEVLYYADNDHTPELAISIKGQPVVPRNWTKYLHVQEHYEHRPLGMRPQSRATFCFGYPVPLKRLGNAFGSPLAAEKKEASQLDALSGVYYYHHDRLVVPLFPTSLQRKRISGPSTTTVKIVQLGRGLVGVCRENFLKHPPNLSGSTHGAPQAGHESFESLTLIISKRMGVYLSSIVAPKLAFVLGRTEQDAASGSAATNWKQNADKRPSGKASGSQLEPGARVRADDGTVGRAVPCELHAGYYRLELPNYELSVKRYHERNLKETRFDPKVDVPEQVNKIVNIIVIFSVG